jgi:tetratricopeptide (TPR) repeat protein
MRALFSLWPLVTALAFIPAPLLAQTPRELRDRAAEFAYNLDHQEGIRILRDAVLKDPNDPATHRALASSVWVDILYRRGAITVDHYLGSVSRTRYDVQTPPPELDAEFKREVAMAIQLAEQRVKAAPKDAQAHYDLGTSLGLQASYVATVEGKFLAAFRSARRSYDEQERALQLDPRRKDAGLIIGTYRYLVSSLSLPMRLMAYVSGFGGGKDRGIRMIEESARMPSEDQTDALFALVLIYNREKRYEDAMRVLAQLRQRYPRNRLAVLENGATAVRSGKAAEAETILSEGIAMFGRDVRPKVPGERALWHLQRGAARVQLGRREDAEADLREALRPDAASWVQGRAHLELARLAVQRGDRPLAQREANLAATACAKDDPICVEQSKRIVNERH